MSMRIVAISLLFVCALGAVASQAAEGVGTLRMRPGHWQVREQIWFDGREVLSALNEAARRINDDVRASLAPADREAFDREAARQGSLGVESDCVSEADSRRNARAALEQMMRSLHAPPWSCSFRDDRASSSGFFYRYSCRTGAGGRADGEAQFTLRGDTEYTGTIEGTSHAIDNATGAPLEPRILQVRSLSTGRWVGQQCPAEAADDEGDASPDDPTGDDPAEE